VAEETDCENGKISNFQRHVTLTFTLDRTIWHTIVHLPTYQIPFESENLFVDGRTNGRTDVRTDGQTSRPALLGRLGGVDLKIDSCLLESACCLWAPSDGSKLSPSRNWIWRVSVLISSAKYNYSKYRISRQASWLQLLKLTKYRLRFRPPGGLMWQHRLHKFRLRTTTKC